MVKNNFSSFRDQERDSNKSDVIDSLIRFGEMSAKDLWKIINHYRGGVNGLPVRPKICLKTVQRHLKDSRVIKNKTRYRINDKARSEIRYRRPETFGHDILSGAFENFPYRFKYDIQNSSVTRVDSSKIMNEYIKRFGSMIIFAFMEAARPFEDESMTPMERERLVTDWIRNSIPLQEMFNWFRAEFTSGKVDERRRRKIKASGRYIPYHEIEVSEIDNVLEAFKKTNPKLCKNLILKTQLHRKVNNSEIEQQYFRKRKH